MVLPRWGVPRRATMSSLPASVSVLHSKEMPTGQVVVARPARGGSFSAGQGAVARPARGGSFADEGLHPRENRSMEQVCSSQVGEALSASMAELPESGEGRPNGRPE